VRRGRSVSFHPNSRKTNRVLHVLLRYFLSQSNIDFGSELSDAAIKHLAIDGGLGTGGSADGGAMSDAGVGEEAKGGGRSQSRSNSFVQHLD
jgi:hypothetical protein